MIRACSEADLSTIYTIINAAANAYRGVIPDDCWHEPYMGWDELRREVAANVTFFGWDESGELTGVMGLQVVRDATLIRHAYVRPGRQGAGIGSALLQDLIARTKGRLLVGTWADATWAIKLYERHGFRLVPAQEKDLLLDSYWTISPRQREVSVVLNYNG